MSESDKNPAQVLPPKWDGVFNEGTDTIPAKLSMGCPNLTVRQKPQWQHAVMGQVSQVAAHPWTVQLSIYGKTGSWKW